MKRIELDRAIHDEVKIRWHTWGSDDWVFFNGTVWIKRRNELLPPGYTPPPMDIEDWTLWQEPTPEIVAKAVDKVVDEIAADMGIEPEELDQEAAVKAFAAGEEIVSLRCAGYPHRLGNGKPITFLADEKWRIVKPAPVEELTFEDAVQLPGKYQSTHDDSVTLIVGSSCYEFYSAHGPMSWVSIRRTTTDRYTRIEVDDE